jgi:hypothetical protein
VTFTEALRAAKDTTDAQAYISRVKTAVSEELSSMDSSVVIEDTHYFNHTAVPDLVLSWPKEQGKRSIFLRHSYEAVAAADDAHYLPDADPVVLTLKSEVSPEVADYSRDRLTSQTSQAPRLLLTDPQAVDVMGARSNADSPLSDLVRANFIRGGRGFIDQPRANDLITFSDPDNNTDHSVADLIGQSFSEEAAARITRTSQLIAIALDPNLTLTDGDAALIGGRLSVAELRHLVPWLLQQEQALTNARFWEYLGELVSFAEIENIRGDLVGLDLSPLITANANRWIAKWAYMGLSVPIQGDDTYLERSNVWSFLGSGAIGIDVGEQRLSIAFNGQLASKGRHGSSAATWDMVQETLAEDKLARIDLRGVSRSVTLHAERSPDIRADIQKVAASLDDSYTVNDVVIRLPAPHDEEGTTELAVNFGSAVVVAASGASLSDLARISMKVLNYRTPSSDLTIASLFSPTDV